MQKGNHADGRAGEGVTICGGSRGCLVLRKQNRCRFLHRKADLEKIISARKCLHTPCPTTCRRMYVKSLPCVRLVQIKTIDNCFYQTVSPKARSIGREAMRNARDDYETATGKRGTAIAVEGLFRREATSSPNNPTASHSFGTSPCTGEAMCRRASGKSLLRWEKVAAEG